MRKAGSRDKIRRFSRSWLRIDEVKRNMDMPAPPPADVPDEGNMADKPTIIELDDAFLGLNHQDAQEMDGVDDGRCSGWCEPIAEL